MFDKLLKSKGYSISDSGNQVFTQEPFQSGYGLVYVDLPTALKQILVESKKITDYVIINTKSCDIPNTSISNEPVNHGRNAKSFMPMQREDAHEVNIVLYENRNLTTISILQMWQDLVSNPVDYISSIVKNPGESLQDLIKSTITLYVFDPTTLARFNTDSILVVKFYGSYIANVDSSRFNLDVDNVDIVTVSATISTDRPIIFTKELSEFRGLSNIYYKSIKNLSLSLQETQNKAFSYFQQQIENLYDKLNKINTEGK